MAARARSGSQPGGTEPGGEKSHSYMPSTRSTSPGTTSRTLAIAGGYPCDAGGSGVCSVPLMKNPRAFFHPLAIDAPDPPQEIPFKPSRMIHFFDASNEKMRAKVPDMAKQADILLGNLEDAVPVDKKIPAREGLIQVAKEVDFGETQLWTRVNELASPWVLDDLTQLVTEIGDKLEVIMVPKVEGP